MNPEKDIFRLKHILESIEKIEFISNDLTFENFAENWIYQDAVVRNLEIIGEASNHVSEASKNQNPDVSWNEIRGLRNIVAHIYFDINKEQIWETIQDDLPVLKSQILSILNDLERKNI